MKRNIASLVIGIVLVLVGAISLLGNTFLQTEAWKLWPVAVVLLGLGLTAPALFAGRNPALAAFYFPSLPVLATGGILLYASLSGNWGIWAVAWPLIVLAVGLSFALAALFMRVAALAIPAVIILVNGAMLGFTAVTGQWAAWLLLWPVEPLAVGIGLLILAYFSQSNGTRLAGVILCAIAGGLFFVLSFVSVFNETALRFLMPALLVLTGLILVGATFVRREKPAADLPAAPQSE
jgi:hypothetical protein